MKFKDYFLKLKEQGSINNEDYAKFLETVPEGEMPDAIFQVLENTFLTADRAATHQSVHSKLKRDFLDPVDNFINDLVKALPADVVIDLGPQLDKTEGTYKKLAAIKGAIPSVIQKASSKGVPDESEWKKKITEKEGIIQDLTGKIEKINGEYQSKEKQIANEWEGKFKNYRLDSELEKLANNYTFADAYQATRPTITKAILAELKTKHLFDLAEKDGQTFIQVMEADETGKPKGPKFNGNSLVTIQSLLDEPLKPFLKQNNQEGGQGRQEQKQFQVDTQQNKPRTGARVEVK